MLHRISKPPVMLGTLLAVHFFGVAMAWIPMWAFIDRWVSESMIGLLNAVLPVGAMAAFLIGSRAHRGIRSACPKILAGVEVLMAGAFVMIWAGANLLEAGRMSATTFTSLIMSVMVTLGLLQSISFALLFTWVSGNCGPLFPRVRAGGSLGFVGAGIVLSAGLNVESGHQLLIAALAMVASAITALRCEPPSGVESPASRVMQINAKGLLIGSVLLSMVETIFNLHAQRLLAGLGSIGNVVLPSAIAVEIVLLLKMPKCVRGQIPFLVLTPAAWICVSLAMADYAATSNAAYLPIVLLQGTNVTFGTVLASLLGTSFSRQAGLVSCQALGTILGSLTSCAFALGQLGVFANFMAATILAVGTLMVVGREWQALRTLPETTNP